MSLKSVLGSALNILTLGLWSNRLSIGRGLRRAIFGKMPAPPNAQAGEVKFPQLGTGNRVPILMGTRRLTGTIVWWGDVQETKIIKGKSHKQTVGFWYSCGIQFALAKSVDLVHEIYAGELKVWDSYAGVGSGSVVPLTGRDQFGGFDVNEPGGEGGLDGTMNFFGGGSGQIVNAYLHEQVGSPAAFPAYRGVATAIWRGVFGTRPAPREFSFVGECIDAYSISGTPTHIGTYGMNPAVMIYRIYSMPDVLGGIPTDLIDMDSIKNCGNQLVDENFGLSFLFDDFDSADDLAEEVLRHIDGRFQYRYDTGLYTLSLDRAPDIDTLPLFTRQNGVVQIEAFSTLSDNNLVSEFVVGYTDGDGGNYKRDTARWDNPASILSTGRTISKSVDYDGICSYALALRVAERDGRALGTPLSACQLVGDRRMSQLMPGDCFRLSVPDRGIEHIVLRVEEIDLGLPWDGEVKIKAAEDIFSINSTVLTEQQPIEWTPSGGPPEPLLYTLLIELPYHLLDIIDGVTPATLSPTLTYMGMAGVPADANQTGATMFVYDGAEYQNEGAMPFAAMADSTNSVDRSATVITIDDEVGMTGVSVGDLALWGDEWLKVTGKGSGTITLARGCLDTVPTAHAADSRIVFLPHDVASDQDSRAPSSTVQAKGVTRSLQGTLDIGDADAVTATMQGRHYRPYPPADVEFDSVNWPTSLSGEIEMTWAHRNRVEQSGTVIDYYAASVTPASDLRYRIRFTGTGGVIYESNVVAGDELTFELAYSGSLTIDLWALDDRGQSLMPVTVVVSYSGSTTKVTHSVYGANIIIDGGDLDG